MVKSLNQRFLSSNKEIEISVEMKPYQSYYKSPTDMTFKPKTKSAAFDSNFIQLFRVQIFRL